VTVGGSADLDRNDAGGPAHRRARREGRQFERKIRGVPLTVQQFDDYVRIAGQARTASSTE